MIDQITHPPLAYVVTPVLAILTILGGVVICAFAYLLWRHRGLLTRIIMRIPFAARGWSYLAAGGAIMGMVLTLVYSEVFLYEPCVLCWYQRVFLYSLIPLYLTGAYMKDAKVFVYAGMLSFCGVVIAAYHHALQIGFDIYKPCSTALFAADCSKPSFIEYGFVTFPFMALVLFAGFVVYNFIMYRVLSGEKKQ